MQLPPSNPKEASFLVSVAEASKLPQHPFPEMVFFGASNVGKSSLLNALFRQKNLAKTSKTPGRTQLLNFFWLPFRAVLVDAPGYGFAETPESVRENWQDLLLGYLDDRRGRLKAYLLMDSRRWVRPHDTDLMRLLQQYNIQYQFVFTKMDKLSKMEVQKLDEQIREQMGETCPPLRTSAKNKVGLGDLEKNMRSWRPLSS